MEDETTTLKLSPAQVHYLLSVLEDDLELMENGGEPEYYEESGTLDLVRDMMAQLGGVNRLGEIK